MSEPTPLSLPTSPPRLRGEPVVRPLPLTAAVVAGLVASAGLGACVLVTLGGWLLSGVTGGTWDAVRAGVNAWLLGHRAGLIVDGTPYSLAPLALTTVICWLVFRACRWSARTAPRAELRDIGLAAVVFTGVYTVIAEVAAVAAARADVSASLGQVVVGCGLISLLFGAAGLWVGSPSISLTAPSFPEGLDPATLRTSYRVALWVLAGAAVVTLASMLVHAGEMAAAFSRLEVGWADGALVVVMMLLVLPNAVLWTLSVLLGPGFTVGQGTYVTVSGVALGPVPGFPLLAALPAEGRPSWWFGLLLALPAVVTLIVVARDLVRSPVTSWRAAALRGGIGGGLAGVLCGLLVALSGGALGDGRLAHVGPGLWAPLGIAAASMAVAGLAGALGTTAVQRRWDSATVRPSA